MRHVGVGLLLAVTYIVVYAIISFSGVLNVAYDEQYSQATLLNHLKDFVQLMAYTWVPLDYMSAVYPPTRNWFIVAATALMALPFLIVLTGRWRQLKSRRVLALVVCFFILVSPHLVTLVSIMHNYAALSLAALVVAGLISSQFTVHSSQSTVHGSQSTIYITNEHPTLDDARSTSYFSYIDTLTTTINRSHDTQQAVSTLLLRAVAYSVLQNYEAAIEDLTTYLQIDSTSVPALWQRAVCQSRINRFMADANGQKSSEDGYADLKTANVLGDLNHALALSPRNAYLLYNRGNLYAQRRNYTQAIDDYTSALQHEPALAEAYFNRGLCQIFCDRTAEGVADLSKAGELGLYTAYSIIKKYRK